MGTATAETSGKTAPGPKGHFLTGNLPEFRRDKLAYLTWCAREYGDYVGLRFGPRRILLVSDPKAIEWVLTTGSRHFQKHFALRLNPIVLGNGLLTSEGEFWLRQRRLCQPAFQRERVAQCARDMIEQTQRVLETWQAGESRDVLAEMMRVTLGIAAKTLFDADVSGKASEVGVALQVAQDAFVARFHSMLPIPASIPTPTNWRLRRAVRKLDEIIYDFIGLRKTAVVQKNDLLSILLHARDEHRQGMTDKQLRDEAMTLFLAGHETTALTLAWAWTLLAQHPEAQARLLGEVDGVLEGRSATAADCDRLRYTEAVACEAMRLYPPAFIIGREAVRACRVGPYEIPAKMTVLMSQWVMHRDPRFWEKADEFRPERWLEKETWPRFAYFPFGGGPRRCIGEAFATLETTLVLATIAQQFRFTLEPGATVVPSPSFTLRPKDGVPAVVERR